MRHQRLRHVAALLTGSLLLAACTGGAPTPAEPQAKPPTAAPKPKDEESKYAPLYAKLWSISDPGPAIPGLKEDVVPQGLAYWPERNWLLVSGYVDNGTASTLTIVDAGTQAVVKRLFLAKEDGKPYTGHAGGVAVSRQYAWISSEERAYWIPLADLAAAGADATVRFGGSFLTPTRASFTTWSDGILWVGEFYTLPDYPTDPSHELKNNEPSTYHAWVAGYVLDPATDQPPGAPGQGEVVPDYILAIPDKVQGMAVTPNHVILSQSFGRAKDSSLLKYEKPKLQGAPHQQVTVGGKQVPVWFLDRKNLSKEQGSLTVPPMSEGIVTDGANRLFVLFESGALKYRSTASAPMDRMRVIRLGDWK
jgi:hypothetical protein